MEEDEAAWASHDVLFDISVKRNAGVDGEVSQGAFSFDGGDGGEHVRPERVEVVGGERGVEDWCPVRGKASGGEEDHGGVDDPSFWGGGEEVLEGGGEGGHEV